MRIDTNRWAVTCVLCALLTTLSSAVVAASPAQDLAALRKEVVDGVKKKDDDRVIAAIHQLVAEGSATAGEIIIEDALRCDRPDLEERLHEVLERMPESPAFTWFCTRANDHKSAEVRVQLIQILTYRNERDAFRAVLTALYDPKPAVQFAAIESLRKRGHRGAIPHLIKALESEVDEERELGQIAAEIRSVLNRWTGKDLFGAGEYQEIWSRYKEILLDPDKQKKKDPLGKVTLERRGTSVYVKVPQFFGQEILSQRVVFILDTSISMKEEDPPPPPEEEKPRDGGSEGGKSGGTSVGGGKKKPEGIGDRARKGGSRQRLKRVQNELVRMISDLPSHFQFTVVSFDDDISVFSKRLHKATKGKKRQAIQFVRNFSCDGETWTDHALEAAFDVEDARTFVLLSDGQPFRGSPPIDVVELLDWVDDKNRFSHVQIHTIGFRATSGRASGFLRDLARRNRGKYTEIP